MHRFEDAYNGQKYVMFEGEYNYTQAAAKCDEEGGIIAMATDKNTFDFLYNMVDVYEKEGGTIFGAFVDGTSRIVNPQSADWFCVNTQGSCPATMPWLPGKLDDVDVKQCVRVYPGYDRGVGNSACYYERMVICKF